jgi:hypothetical protein
LTPGIDFTNQFAQCAKGLALRKWQKDAVQLLTNTTAEFLKHILGCAFCTEHNIFVHFCPMLLPLKSIKIICTYAALL